MNFTGQEQAMSTPIIKTISQQQKEAMQSTTKGHGMRTVYALILFLVLHQAAWSAVNPEIEGFETRRKGQSAWSEHSSNIAAGGLPSNPHIAEVRISTTGAIAPISITLSGGEGFSTASYWWWNGEKKKKARLNMNGQIIEAGAGQRIVLAPDSGTVSGELTSGNLVGPVVIQATEEGSTKSITVNCMEGTMELIPDAGDEVDYIYTWRTLKVKLTFDGEPLIGHDVVVACKTLTQSDGTAEATRVENSESSSRFLTAFLWMGADKGKYELQTTGTDGVGIFKYQVQGFNTTFEFMAMDQHVAKGVSP